MTFGDPNWQPWLLDEAKALPILKHAYDSGINTFDVADAYSNGKSEEILGKFLKAVLNSALQGCHSLQILLPC